MLRARQFSAVELETISEWIPDFEPPLSPCPGGPRIGYTYPVAETRLVGNERRYINECIDSNWISSKGPFVERFEEAFSKEAGTRHAVACTNGTAALHLALAALGVGPGDEVIVPTFTMIATANAVSYTGAQFKLVDAEGEYCNIDPSLIEAAITPATKAIIVVHTYGHPVQINPIADIARRHDLDLIEDAAEAHGAETVGRRVGCFGRLSTFSFYANKITTTGEGGMVCTDDAALATMLQKLRNFAFSTDRHFWHEYLGFNYRMTNLQAAVGLAQVERLDEIVSSRRRLASWYTRRLNEVEGVVVPLEATGVRSVFWMYAIRIEHGFGLSRDKLRSHLAGRGIETRPFFIPMHRRPIYFHMFRGQRFPVADRLCRTGLYLPTSEALVERDVDWICRQIAEVRGCWSSVPANT